ncbi:winged helix-turn-helix transcriptional regulator [Bradyrhizobium genosp. P]|uniref:winged helix-turn-helix transcriptional regulator n=1 Tax=Bradyrhizobium genosp. P TaxID=83641 RepID=UPI003CF4BB8A
MSAARKFTATRAIVTIRRSHRLRRERLRSCPSSFRLRGITHATLSDRLEHLNENELIVRRQTGPDRNEYVLTRKGWNVVDDPRWIP